MGQRKVLGKKGQALVEFALVLPILVLLLIGLMEFALILYNQHVITNASREGARFGIVARATRWDETEIAAVVEAYCLDNMVTFGSGTPDTEIEVTDVDGTVKGTGTAVFSDNLTVTVTFQYDFLVLPNFIAALGANLDLQAQTTMKYE